ncbi:MAG: hypothetical protein DLM72_21245 [Candidatus Nitrosopolaris wilkensis]|nr:MAG: hypothetical protein DLM72_21245 [Candidatus Nitrosopolaris wilkensis]
MTVSSFPKDAAKKHWIDLIGESSHTSDDKNLGEIEGVGTDFVVVRKAFLAVHFHYYYIPFDRVEGWDGSVAWLRIPKEEVERDYAKHEAPDPTKYYVKDRPGIYPPTSYPEVIMIESRNKKPVIIAPTTPGIDPTYKCDLCDISLKTEDELSNHVKAEH